jgi:hypothetical protein
MMQHGIKDNRSRCKVADFLRTKITSNSHLSVVSAYFAIYAYDALMRVRMSNDMIHWVRFFLTGMAETAAKGRELSAKGVLTEITGLVRKRIYIFEAYLKLGFKLKKNRFLQLKSILS